jgi:hypothetical protein
MSADSVEASLLRTLVDEFRLQPWTRFGDRLRDLSLRHGADIVCQD